MKRRGRRSSNKAQDFNSREGILAFVDEMMPDVKPPKGMRAYARTKSDGATGGALKTLDDRIRKITAQNVSIQATSQKITKTVEDNTQAIKRLGSSISALETRIDDVTEQSNKTLGMLGDLLESFNKFKKETDAKFTKIEKEKNGSSGGLGSMLDVMSTVADVATARQGAKQATATAKAPTVTSATAKTGLMKSVGSLAKGVGGKLPVVGGLVQGIAEFVEGGDLGRSIAAGAGNVLGGIIGGALGTVIAPGVGTAVGAVGGSMAGAELAKSGFDWIFGKKAPKESTAIKEARAQQEKPADSTAAPQAAPASAPPPASGITPTASAAPSGGGTTGGGNTTTSSGGGGGGGSVTIPAGGKDSATNKKIFINAMNEAGIKNDEERAAMAAVIQGESNFTLLSETSYSGTDNARIRMLFGSTVSALTDAQLNELKRNDEAFFNRVYGGRLGNAPNEGFKYRGRGFIQLTGKGNYEKYSRITGVDLVSNPDLANDPAIAAKVAAIYMMKTRGPGSTAYEQIARGVGNAVGTTEEVKKASFAQFMKTSEFSSDKAGQTPQQSADGGENQKAASAESSSGGSDAIAVGGAPATTPPGASPGGMTPVAASGAAPAASGTPNTGGSTASPDAAATQKDTISGYQKGKGTDFSADAKRQSQGGMTTLTTARSKRSFVVASDVADKFKGFVDELESTGYQIKDIGGYRGGAGQMWHGKGYAIDINPADNPMYKKLPDGGLQDQVSGRRLSPQEAETLKSSRYPKFGYGKDNLPPNISQIAAKWGLGWGGNWQSSVDTMHFSAGANEGGTGTLTSSDGGATAAGSGTGGTGVSRAAPPPTATSTQGTSAVRNAESTTPSGVMPGTTTRAQIPGMMGSVAGAQGMGPLSGILGRLNIAKQIQMPQIGTGIVGSISSTILGQAVGMAGSKIGGLLGGVLSGPGGIARSGVPGAISPMIGPMMGALGRGGPQGMSMQQPLNALFGMVGNLMNNMNRGNQPQQRNPNMQFTPDNYQDGNVPRAMPPQNIMREMFGYDIASGYYPPR